LPAGVTLRIGDGTATNIASALGNIVITGTGASGLFKGFLTHIHPMKNHLFSIPAI
jgi:hypothetical protein